MPINAISPKRVNAAEFIKNFRLLWLSLSMLWRGLFYHLRLRFSINRGWSSVLG